MNRKLPFRKRTEHDIDLSLRFECDPLRVVHHSQQIAAPEFFDLFFAVAAADQFDGDVKRFAGVVPAFDTAAAVEVGCNADVIDADQFHNVVDVVDEVFNRCRRVAGKLFVDFTDFLFVLRALCGWHIL